MSEPTPAEKREDAISDAMQEVFDSMEGAGRRKVDEIARRFEMTEKEKEDFLGFVIEIVREGNLLS
jgi:hypothetical protein